MSPKFLPLLLAYCMVCVLGQELKNHAILDPNGTYHVFWEVKGENITFECQVATKGYVGFGFSPKGGMPGADVIIGWVLPNGDTNFHDRHAVAFAEPLIDTVQNYHLLNAFENDTHTVLRFTRKLDTCDRENDTVITDNTIKIIYSWHPDDPPNITGLPYHGPDRRGTRESLLLSVQPAPIQITDDIMIWDLQIPNVTIPAKLTTYWCVAAKVPTLEVPHYYTGFTVHVTPGNEHVVHHFDLYECRGNATHNEERYQQRKGGYECAISGTVMDPLDCQPVMIVWAVGSQGQTLPEGVGIPFGQEPGAISYLMLQMHYTNVNKKAGIIDNSILRLYLTKKDVPNKAATLQIYTNVDYTMPMPPQLPMFNVTAYCPAECTQQRYPKDGITVFAVGLHTHLAGRKLSLRHFRGNKELKPLAVDDNYDFNYQQIRQLEVPVKIMPGDMLMGTCVYSTMDRNETVTGGYGTDEEMCFFYLSYYPVTNLTLCIGGPSYQEIIQFFGVEKLAEDNVHIVLPVSLQNQSMFDYVRHYDWSKVDDAKMKKLTTMQYEAVKNFTCSDDPNDKASYATFPIGYPFDIPPYMPPPDMCDLVNNTSKAPKLDDYGEKKTTPSTTKKHYYYRNAHH